VSQPASTPPSGAAPKARGNVLSLSLTRGFLVGAGIAIQVAAARLLGPSLFGVYGFIQSVVALFSFGATLGLNMLLIREIAREPASAARRTSEALPVVAALSAVTMAVVCGYVQLRDGRPDVVLVTALAALTLAFTSVSQIVQASFHGLRRMDLEVTGIVVGRAIAVFASIAMLLAGMGLPGLMLGQLLGATATLGIELATFRAHVGQLRPVLVLAEAKRLLTAGLPFGLNLLFAAIYLQLDILLLKEFRDDDALGLYRAAAILVLNLPILAQVLSAGTFPTMSRHHDAPERAGAALTFLSRVLLLISVPIAAGGLCVSERLIVVVAGDAYRSAGLLLAIMLPLIPLRFVNNAFGMTLTATDRQGLRTQSVVIAALFNGLSNLYAIPRWGAEGAATTTLITEVLLTALFYAHLGPVRQRLHLTGSFVRTALPASVMALVVLALGPMPMAAVLTIAAAIYTVLTWLTGAWSVSDLSRLKAL